MAYSAPRTWAAGEHPTAAQFNQDIRDNVSFLGNPPACRVYRSTVQSYTDATEGTQLFDTERYDTNTMHDTSTNTGRITIKTAGIYIVTFRGRFAAAADYSQCYAILKLNGATTIDQDLITPTTFNTNPSLRIATQYKFAVNDYIEVIGYQDNTANAARNMLADPNFGPEFAATWVGLG